MNAQTCFDWDELTIPLSYYNSPTSFPAGSVLHQIGDIKMINYTAADDPTNPTILDSIRTSTVGRRIYFDGRLDFDFSDFPSECKKVAFGILCQFVYIDSYVLDLGTGPSFPIDVGDSIHIYVDPDIGLTAVGKFNTMSFQSPIVPGPKAFIETICLEECSGTDLCEVDFNFSVTDSIVNFTNLSSIGPESDLFVWNFPDLSESYEENPTYLTSENGKHEVCLFVLNSECKLGGPTFNKCDSIEIDIHYIKRRERDREREKERDREREIES